MPRTPEPAQPSEDWVYALTHGHRPLVRLARVVNRFLPGAPRCKNCYRPFGGVGGMLAALTGVRRSRKNPTMCDF